MDIPANALVTQLSRAAVEPPAEASPALPAAAPNELAAARFAQLMKATNGALAVAPPDAAALPKATEVGVPLSLGDRMLASLQGASNDFKSIWRVAESRLQTDQTMTLQEMMAMQLQVTQMTVQYDLLGKVVSRSAQNFDQLVRVQ